MRLKHLVVTFVLLMLTLPVSPAHAGGVVNVCDEAHLLAALTGGGTVTFACSGTITLTAEITIAVDTAIDGSGQNVAISGNHAVRVFIVNSGVALSLNEISITQGYFEGRGGGIRNHGTLSVSNSTFSGNSGRTGGGILNDYDSTVTVSNSTFVANSARSGGGISSYGTLTVDHSTFSANTASNNGTGSGGGIASSGTGIVSNSTFSGNSSPNGGGIYNGDLLTVSNSTFSGNSSSNGGGIYNWNMLTIRNTIVANSLRGITATPAPSPMAVGTSAIPTPPVPASTPIHYSAPYRTTAAPPTRWISAQAVRRLKQGIMPPVLQSR